MIISRRNLSYWHHPLAVTLPPRLAKLGHFYPSQKYYFAQHCNLEPISISSPDAQKDSQKKHREQGEIDVPITI